jgi:hypothetical protein
LGVVGAKVMVGALRLEMSEGLLLEVGCNLIAGLRGRFSISIGDPELLCFL